MLKRQSSLNPLALASLRSRFASASKSAISWTLVLCALSHPFFCQSLKLIGASDQIDLLALDHAVNEMALCTPLRSKFVRVQHERIDLPTDPLLFFRQQSRHRFKRNALVGCDHHQVQITRLALFAAREGTKYERHDNLIFDHPKRLPHAIADAHRPHNHLLE